LGFGFWGWGFGVWGLEFGVGGLHSQREGGGEQEVAGERRELRVEEALRPERQQVTNPATFDAHERERDIRLRAPATATANVALVRVVHLWRDRWTALSGPI